MYNSIVYDDVDRSRSAPVPRATVSAHIVDAQGGRKVRHVADIGGAKPL